MELEEREAKVCRLCGQFERLYIDVFGEEGMRRYLSVKIHSKINIMIDERDPLPKAICVQCLGKLEFVCDFQEECLRTQHELRDRYNLPPLTELMEIKNEDTPPTRSADNNNSIEKNLNSTSGEDSEQQQQQQRVLRRSLRSQQQSLKSVNDEISIEENSQSSQSIQSTELTPTRWLRRRHNVDSTTSSVTNNNERDEEIPIASRLRSHNNNADNSNQANASSLSVSNSDNESAVEKQHSIQDSAEGSTIQLPTSALNKLLTLVSGAPDIEVSVNESRNRGDVAGGGNSNNNSNNNSNSSSNDAEDISFTVELCRKSTEDDPLPELKVRARVFPDQGSCLVDAAIVDLLQNSQGTTGEVNGIVNSILSSTGKNNGIATSKLKDLAKLEEMTEAMQKPEELFRIDGEEIKVDDNVEHVTNDGQNGYACKLCRKFYERRDKCTVHVKTHLGIKQYTCVICNAKFVCKSDVMKHIRCSHTNPRPIQCPKCPKRFKSKFYLTEHDNVHKGVRPYSCTDCGQSYHHKVSLQIHMKSHLPPQNLACEYCGKVFPYRTRLLSHIASVHMKKRRNFRCRFCYNLYSSLSVLNEHVKTRHSTTHICGICGKTFKVVSKFKAHVMQHSNPKPFVCNICNNRYASKAFLNEHLLKHEGLRKHKCKTCNASFAQASHLAAHRHVHGEKTHVCPECGRKFNRRDNMKVHRKRHFEQKKSGTGKQKATASNTTDSVAASTATNEKYAIRDRRSEYDYVQKETHSVFQPRKYLHALPRCPERKIMENDGLPQQVCARCCAKLDFTCDFFEDCRSVQETFSIITSQNTEAAINQRNDIGIEDESENGNKDEVEIEADKENTVPVVTNSKNSRKVRRYSRQRSIKKHEKNITPLKEQIRNIVTTNGLNKDSNTARPSCKSQVIIVKQEDINGEKASSQSRKPVETSSKSDDLVRIPIEKSNDSSMYQEKKAPCVNVTSDNQVESKVNDESDSTLAQTTNINLMNGFSLAETDNITKTAVALPVQSDFLVLEKSHQEAQTNMQDGSSCVSGKDKSGKRNSIKISQLMTEEEKRLVETSYKINLSLMKCEVQNKMTVLNKDNIKCNICGANYSRSDKCRVHIMNHLEIKPYECVKCDYSTVTISNIRAHIRKCHLKIKPYACDQCDKRYGSMILLQEHINSHTGVRPFKCEICDFTYMSRQGLNCHYKTHKLNKDIKCDICPKMFKSTARKNAHMLVHNKENMIQCLICKNYLSSETNLHTHMKKVHSQKYVCDICNKEMLSRKNLYNHKNVHMKAKYKCMLCFKFYKNKHILKEHMLKHEGIRKYKCNDCDKTFAQQSHLAAHSATHSDVRFPCAGCGKQFNRRDNMKMHTKRCQLFLHQSVSTFVPKIRDKLVNIQNENNMTR